MQYTYISKQDLQINRNSNFTEETILIIILASSSEKRLIKKDQDYNR